VAEGALSKEQFKELDAMEKKIEKAATAEEKVHLKAEYNALTSLTEGSTMRLASMLEELTGLESRVTILGHLQRGGTPSAADRLLATRLGTACADYVEKGIYGVMVAIRGDGTEPVPLEKVVGVRKTVPLNHEWIKCARAVGTCMGDK
jgi:6-phosphofructokinase 1